MARKSKRESAKKVPEIQTLTKKLKTAAYVRLSRERDGDSSIQTQISMIHKYIEDAIDLELYETYVDNGETGTDFDRAEFQNMIMDIYDGKIQCVVVKDLSRFGRNLIEGGNFIENIFPKLGIRFIAITDDYDNSIPENRDSLTIPLKNMINSMYAKDSSRKQVASFELHSRIGDRKIISVPYGYSLNKEENKLEPNPETAPIVKLIFSWFSMGTGAAEIIHRLNDLHIKAPTAYKDRRGEGLWNKTSLTCMLKNEAYIGNLVYGKARSAYYKGIKTHKTPREEWIIHENTHEPLVTREQFERVSERISENNKAVELKKAGGVRKCVDIFHQKIKCKECGRTMTYWPKYNHTVLMTGEYKCYSAGKSGDTSTGCDVRAVGKIYNGCLKTDGSRRDCGKKVHEAFVRIVALDSIRTLLSTVTDLKNAVAMLERKGGIIDTMQRKKNELQQGIEKAKSRIESGYMDYSSQVLSHDEFIEIRGYYISEERKLTQEIQQIDSEISVIRKKVKDFRNWAEKIDGYDFDNPELEQVLFNELISEIYITDNLEFEVVFYCSDIIAEINKLLG